MTVTTSAATDSRYRRSPLLLVEWDGDRLVLVHCDSLRRFRVDERLLDLLSRLDNWTSPDDLAATGSPVSDEELAALAQLGVIERSAATEANGAGPHPYWNPLDLAVQRHQNVGGYRESEVRSRGDSPPPAFKPRPPGPSTDLPAAGDLRGQLGDVLASRRSIRTYADRPLRLEDLSTLLYHSARVVKVFTDDILGEHVFRPFPGGGARSELELYVVANDVDGLAPGAHYYDARVHDLVQVCQRDDDQARINRWLKDATGGMLNRDAQAVLVITAVFARVMWKYKGISLGVIYRDTGCLYQTLYLVATSLGLAPCGIGAGPERDNARWLGLDPLVESQVGCFLIGSR